MVNKRKSRFRLRFRFIVAEEYQPIETISKKAIATIFILVFVTLALQMVLNGARSTSRFAPTYANFAKQVFSIDLELRPPQAVTIELPTVPGAITLSSLALGDKVVFAKAITLWLQAFDNQKGQSISFRELDYDKVVAWLRTILTLDSRTQYPLLNAAQVYTSYNDKDKILTMIEFIHEQFLLEPATRWEWMATATTLAKNKVEDLDLALKYAHDLRIATEGIPHVPNWARQMEIFLLKDLNQYESSANLMLRLIESGEITDPQEFSFLWQQLHDLLVQMLENRQIESREQLQEMFDKLDLLQSEFLKRASV